MLVNVVVMREEVQTLVSLGPLPAEGYADVDRIARHERALNAIARPVSDEEARQLVKVFGTDGCFGLAWSLVHLIETAPGWPLRDAVLQAQDEWAEVLRQRAINGGVW